jgi:hypothetical protein
LAKDLYDEEPDSVVWDREIAWAKDPTRPQKD